jgi:LmbE family N-acetylglucosaminyl deacetylase
VALDVTILAVTAHPDDEGACSGSLARYAKEGARVYVACATRGDGVDAQIKDASLATRDTLARVRSQELACACEKLGIQPPLFLEYQDGEVDQVPVEAAARKVARLIRELQASLVITHDPLGGYGHPDHIAVSKFVTLAFDLASDPSVDLGWPPFRPAKLYYWATPRSFLEKVPAFRERRADIRGEKLGFVGVPDEQITTEVPIRDWLPTKLAALACHRTQFEFDENGQPKTFAVSVPEELRLKMFGHERFILAKASMAKANIPKSNPQKEDDLLAGLR